VTAGLLVAGRYELVEAVGAGSTATVYRARDTRTGFSVAVKLAPLAADGRPDDHVARAFAREATSLARVSSPHVASLHDHGLDPRHGAFLVSDLVDGRWLSTELLGRPFFPHEVLRVSRGLLAGLAAAHAAGVLHEDLKPSNVLVPRDRLEGAVLVDFGASRALSPREDDVFGDPGYGTLRYVAPERLAGRPGDTRSDVFSAGMLLYELLGYPLVRETSLARSAGLAVPLEPIVPEPLASLLARMVALDPSRRFVTANDALVVVSDLETAPVPIRTRSEPTRAESVRAREASGRPDPLPTRLAPSVDSEAPPSSRSGASREGIGVRLFRLSTDVEVALREGLDDLDLVMLEALARRESGPHGSAVRALVKALRLEPSHALSELSGSPLDGAVAMVAVEPLLGPRAFRANPSPRVAWDEAVRVLDPELSAALALVGAVLAPLRDAPSSLSRVRLSLQRLREDDAAPRGLLATLALVETALTAEVDESRRKSALSDIVAGLSREARERSARSTLSRLASSFVLGRLARTLDPDLARHELSYAAAIVLDVRAAALEASVLNELGARLVRTPEGREEGLGKLVRVETLAAFASAPLVLYGSLSARGRASLARGRHEEASDLFGAARRAVAEEGLVEEHVLAAALETLACSAAGLRDEAAALAQDLVEPRLSVTTEPTAALALVARALVALVSGDVVRARRDLTRARARSFRTSGDTAEVSSLVELASALVASVTVGEGEPPESLQDASEVAAEAMDGLVALVGETRPGSSSRARPFELLPLLSAVVERVEDPKLRASLVAATRRAVAAHEAREPSAGTDRERATEPPPPVSRA
jgi:serine/threonine protein kinase